MPPRRTNSGLTREVKKLKAEMALLQEKADGYDELDNKHRRLKKSFKAMKNKPKPPPKKRIPRPKGQPGRTTREYKNGRVSYGYNLFDVMQEASVPIDTQTYNTFRTFVRNKMDTDRYPTFKELPVAFRGSIAVSAEKKFEWLDDFAGTWPVDAVIQSYYANIKSYKRDRETGALSKRRAARRGTEDDDEEVEPRGDEQDGDEQDGDEQGGDEQDGDEGGNADDYQGTWRLLGSPGQGDDDGGLDGEKDKEDEESNTESEGEVATRKRKAPVLAADTDSDENDPPPTKRLKKTPRNSAQSTSKATRQKESAPTKKRSLQKVNEETDLDSDSEDELLTTRKKGKKLPPTPHPMAARVKAAATKKKPVTTGSSSNHDKENAATNRRSARTPTTSI